MQPPVTLAVLAGGASRRMGVDKPALEVAGSTMLDLALAAAGELPTLVVGRPHRTATWVADPGEPGGGPLAGLVAALQTTGGPVVLVGADQPWLRGATVARLATEEGDVPVAPTDGGHRQVLCARYPLASLDAARRTLDAGGGLQSLLDLGCRTISPDEWRRWGEDGRSWHSVDTPEDLVTGLALYGDPG